MAGEFFREISSVNTAIAGGWVQTFGQKMKSLILSTIAVLIAAAPSQAHPQIKHLKEAYRSQGDSLFIPLYWLPETRQIVLKHIPDHHNWVGFEGGLWKKLKEETKLLVLEELGAEFERLDGPKLDATWKRIRDWQNISSQLSLLVTFLDGDEVFLGIAFQDPVLRPVFKWITDRRGADFDTKHIGSTFSSGEMASFYPLLTEHLLNTDEQKRFECFGRLLARVAETKSIKAEQGAAGKPPGSPLSSDNSP